MQYKDIEFVKVQSFETLVCPKNLFWEESAKCIPFISHSGQSLQMKVRDKSIFFQPAWDRLSTY